ncbi:MAG: response regulator [Desulfofustis sp.]|nr:response regulator [Desulfofustis sp.]
MTPSQKVLLVDDERDFLEIMSRYFTRRHIDFAVAEGCLQALDQLDSGTFDVVIMDVSMPGLDGLECMDEIKKLYPAVEVIILTGHAAPNTSLVGMKKGAFDYCLKPVDFAELLEKIQLARKAIEEKKG